MTAILVAFLDLLNSVLLTDIVTPLYIKKYILYRNCKKKPCICAYVAFIIFFHYLMCKVMLSLKFKQLFLWKSNRVFYPHGQHLCKFIGTKESDCIRKEFNSHRIGLGHHYGRRDVMWKHRICLLPLLRYVPVFFFLLNNIYVFLLLRTVPTIVTAHIFCACQDSRARHERNAQHAGHADWLCLL